MYRKLLLCLCPLLVFSSAAMAQDRTKDKGASATAPSTKQLSGMSIVGNDEAPKSLYIVPWKRSEIGAEPTLHMMLTDRAGPVDREEFIRQLEFYEIRSGK